MALPRLMVLCAVVVIGTVFGRDEQPSSVQESVDVLRTEVRNRVATFLAAAKDPDKLSFLGRNGSFERTAAYWRIFEPGIAVVPILMNEYEDPVIEIIFKTGIERITRRKFREGETVRNWWNSRSSVSAEFATLYTRWNQARKKGASLIEIQETRFDEDDKAFRVTTRNAHLGKIYQGLRNFGIDALPHIIELLKAGEYDLLPLFDELTDPSRIHEGHWLRKPDGALNLRKTGPPLDTHTGPPEARAIRILDWWEANKQDWLLPPPSAAKLEPAEKK